MNATRLIYQAADCPSVTGLLKATDRQCWLCGGALDGTGLPVKSFIKSSVAIFEYAHAIDSASVCPACAFCFQEKCEPLTTLTGRDRQQKMRTYSHFVKDGKWIPLTKSNKSDMKELLLIGAFPELAVISDSQQKHLVYKACSNPVGGNGGTVQFEEIALSITQAGLSEILTVIEALYVVFNKTEIGTGQYSQYRIRKFGFREWRELESMLRIQRGTKSFELSLWLAQGEKTDGELTRDGAIANRDSRGPVAATGWNPTLPGLS